MTEKLKAAARQALEALQLIYIAPEHEEYIRVWWPACREAITALRAALSEPDPGHEPVAWMWEETATRTSTGIGGVDRKLLFCRPVDEPWKRNITPLYTHPPKAEPEPVQESVQKPLTLERLHDALVASRIIPPAAVEDPRYDQWVPLSRIEALHRRLT